MFQPRALVADDCPLTAQLHACLLETVGYRTTVVESGNAAALEFHRATTTGGPFELVLLDLDMPDGDGASAARLIRAIEPGPVLATLVCVTGRPLALVEANCLSAGFDHVVAKPIDAETVKAWGRKPRSLRVPAPAFYTPR